MLEEERGTLSRLEQEFVESLAERELLSKNINIEFERDLTLGEIDILEEFANRRTQPSQ